LPCEVYPEDVVDLIGSRRGALHDDSGACRHSYPLAELPARIGPARSILDQYVVTKALGGLFHVLGEEERKIRKDPAARVTDLLKEVFGK